MHDSRIHLSGQALNWTHQKADCQQHWRKLCSTTVSGSLFTVAEERKLWPADNYEDRPHIKIGSPTRWQILFPRFPDFVHSSWWKLSFVMLCESMSQQWSPHKNWVLTKHWVLCCVASCCLRDLSHWPRGWVPSWSPLHRWGSRERRGAPFYIHRASELTPGLHSLASIFTRAVSNCNQVST